jgi:4-hydroxybenzoyl-CoA thioesterase
MSRIKIDLPASYCYKTEFRIGVIQLNYGNHLSNEQVLVFAHEARLRYYKSLGQNEMDFFGTGVIQSDAAVVYKSEAFYDDIITVELAIEDISRVAFDVIYKMYNETQQKDMAYAKVGVVCFDYEKKKAQDVPEPFRLLHQS